MTLPSRVDYTQKETVCIHFMRVFYRIMEPIIKVRYKEKVLLALLFFLPATLGGYPRCDKTPRAQRSDKTPGSHGFSVSVSGSPRKYRPEQVYTIQLSVRL